MAVSSRGRTELPMGKKWKYRDETSPERTKVWTEPKPKKIESKVAVVYYLCRNGHLEHPHFMEVPLSSSEGLYLRDVLNRLNFLRGKGVATMYSWSSKRSYKNGFVWHDLSENDFIYPAHGQEYVLKGSELLEASSRSFGSQDAVSSSGNCDKQLELQKSDDPDSPLVRRRRNQSWSSLNLNEYKVYKAESTAEIAGKAADASTQTDDKRRRRRATREDQEKEERVQEQIPAVEENPTTELSIEEISPPQSSPSPETLESLIKADRRKIDGQIGVAEAEMVSEAGCDRTVNNHQGMKIRASAVLMQLISCGSTSVKEHGFSLISHYRDRLPRGAANQVVSKEIDGLMDTPGFGGLRLEDKEYFSGSLIETKKGSDAAAESPGLKRSSSYNADRCPKLDLAEKEIDGVRAKCLPRKPKTRATKESDVVSRSAHGSKRMEEDTTKL